MPEVTEKIVFFDEFSLTDRPSIFYGWAPVNTKFQVPSDERKKRARLNGLLAVDAINGREYIQLSKEAKTEDIVDYFYHLSIDVKNEGCDLLTVFIDNNSTHKDKMRYNLWLKMRSNPVLQDFRVLFINTPSYSPDFNLAEYIIHQLRLKLLHHLPAKTTLTDIADKIRTFLKKGQLQTQEQVRNTINHILKLGGVECGI
jgi:hypothetical protein